ncbi:MAG TPA: hypothetical protein PK559_02530 [Ignavibacteriaceae bacterium]|nr:hypothetical protein [Ignavibacteriaceae bacterium]
MFTDEQKLEWFDKAVRFQVQGLIFITMRSRKGGVGSWVIEDIGTKKLLNSNLEWEDDIPNPEKDQAFLIRTRYDFETAAMMYEQYKMFA